MNDLSSNNAQVKANAQNASIGLKWKPNVDKGGRPPIYRGDAPSTKRRKTAKLKKAAESCGRIDGNQKVVNNPPDVSGF